ncbi:hypothetical protein IscW_ISCW004984 [Ixodes scapularis]|uniref:Uncharacterized protein n=1 Tax=Ixodes scapularis TaxID=6945 RepID=B7PFV7_IXOSC|nr:hypothetical protein IscW_ISCW004984 [Ixodes scapularis]|eukprot:XP_002434079.1 hypothetical protein IscW_ISCW004984 [Ixodes scapularis]
MAAASNARGQPLIGRSGGRPVDKRSECRRRILYEGPARDRQISAACLLVAGRRQRFPSPVCGPLGCAPTDPGRAGLGGPSPRRPVPGAPGRPAAFLEGHKAARLVQRDPAHGVLISGHRKTSSPLCRAVCVVSFVQGSAPPAGFRMQTRRAHDGVGASAAATLRRLVPRTASQTRTPDAATRVPTSRVMSRPRFGALSGGLPTSCR